VKRLDLKQVLRHLYRPSAREVSRVDVPAMNFLMVDGEGDPNTSATYAEALEALFSLSYALKFAAKKGVPATDYGVMPLEGLWWADDLSDFTTGDRSGWKWTMMIMQPDFITRDLVDATAAEVLKKKDPAALGKVRFEAFEEGTAAQVLHVGPFANEGPTIQRVHDFIEGSGCTRSGKHHEIYLSDIRKADPAKWNTVIRQPMCCPRED
jgi:hypothetical protein